jgi:hypothetical protein
MYSQPGIYNVLDYGMSPAASGSSNAEALQAAIDDAQNSYNPDGAIVLIPSFDGASPPNYGPYQIEIPYPSPAITIPGSEYNATNLLICGTSNGTTLEATGPGTLFSIMEGGGHSVTFQDLSVTAVSDGVVVDDVTAFDVASGDYVSFFRVNVIDCAEAFMIASASTSLLQCSIVYDSIYPSELGCTGILITSGSTTQVNIEQCVLTCANLIENSIGLQIGDSSDYARATDTQISGFYTGILITSGGAGITRGPSFGGLEIDATGSCVLIEPHEQNIYDVSFVNCHFEPTPATSAPSGSGIVLSAGSLGNPGVDTVRLTSCTVAGYPAPYYGLEINGGQNIQVTGGDYSGNGGAGIAILGGAAEVQITGANCVGLSYAGASTATTQQYGIYVTAGQDIQIVGVNCSGNGISSEDQGAGIYLDVAAGSSLKDVRIVGAICSGPTLGGTTSVQEYGIYANGVSGLLIDGCALTGNTGYGAYIEAVENVTVTACDVYSSTSGSKGIAVVAVYPQVTQYVFIRNCNGFQYASWSDVVSVTGVVQDLEVTNCAGYNDVHAELVNSTVAPIGTFSGPIYDYFGPTAFYVAGSATVHIDGYSTSLSEGAFTLAPGNYAEITGPVTHFLMIGQ